MIVVDTNVLWPLCFPCDLTPIAESLWEKDSAWHAPSLWISEYRCVVLKYFRTGKVDGELVKELISAARKRIPHEYTHSIDDESVMELCMMSACTAYDCEYVAVAMMLGAPLVTLDQAILKAFPMIATSPEGFLSR
ncbi:MAG TPA: type II toxin-antitoxin system VapC family toxin [Candidatus Hydrogenedentes bacterium]|nr:type II toxin-antitoxin system VapC family toxin [Candidatus Hydrogenedentota bacterium]